MRTIAATALLALLPLTASAQAIRGRVVDAKTNEGLIEATVKVTRGPGSIGKTALTDLDGNFELALPPGSYELRVFYELYQGRKVSGVSVTADALTPLDVALEADGASVEEVVVETRADVRTEGAILTTRRKASGLSDAISAQEIARTPDSAASDAVKRVVAATVIDGRYVLVRGLGGRYASTLLNGVPLPSVEPDEQAVPLDLFPASLLANLTVAKSYTPDLPGNFGGGALLLTTNNRPDKLELRIKVGFSGDSSSTFQDRPTYDGGSTDFLGYDDGTRGLPDAIPTDQPVRGGAGNMSDVDVERAGEAFRSQWSTRDDATPPGVSLGGTAGGTEQVLGKQVGWLLTGSWQRKLVMRDARVARVATVMDEVTTVEEVRTLSGTEAATIGALGNVGIKLAPGHEIDLFTLYTHAGDSRAQVVEGYSESDGQGIRSTRLQFIQRGLLFGQLRGQHSVGARDQLEVGWQANASITERDEPDTRDITHNVLPDGSLRFKAAPGSGERFFSSLQDRAYGAGLGLGWTVGALRLSGGGSVARSTRTLQARRFLYDFVGTDPSVLRLPAEQMLSPENIGPAFELEERTFAADAYDASLRVLGTYGTAEVALGPVRVLGGARLEVADQSLEAGSTFSITSMEVPGVDRQDLSVLPTASAVLGLSDAMNLRAAWSYTLARPQFRELAPFVYYDPARRRSVGGNPDLEETRIHNADLRWEWFGEHDVVAASVFYKRFADPIERVIVSASAGDLGFANAAGADVYGVELEARGELARFARGLRGLRGLANLTLVRSEIDLGMATGLQTSGTRPLQGQSPYVVNLGLSWADRPGETELGVLYNVTGARISEVGFDTLPDVYERPLHRVDLTAATRLPEQLTLRFAVTNVLARAVRFEQGGVDVYSYDPGVAASASLEWTP